jgi:hypothetical protein
VIANHLIVMISHLREEIILCRNVNKKKKNRKKKKFLFLYQHVHDATNEMKKNLMTQTKSTGC